MSRATTYTAVLCFAFSLAPLAAQPGRGGAAQSAPGRTPSIEDRVAGMQKLDGYFPLYWDDRTGNLYLEIPRFDTEFLYTTGLAAGLGSNDLGLDRGQEGGGRLVSFQRVGPKVLLVQHNESFRSSSGNPAEQRSVEDSFAKSVLWGFTVAAESNGRVLVDATDFVLRDAHGAANALVPGPYRVDRARSAVYMARTKAFPKNSEIEVTLTFANEASGGRGGGFGGPSQGPPPTQFTAPGATPAGGGRGGRGGFGGGLFSGTVASVTPSPEAVTLREHYSLVELPENYKPREDDPRAGYGGLTFVDYSTPIGDPMVRHYLRRHRLEMINWVHRSTRGWSSGATVADPRTGEIIKATVTLGSLRDRQDYMIFEGLLSPYTSGNEKPDILYRTALARIRQLSAHEVGHTLGLGHNYYDSTQGWISVMDYPHPQEKLRDDGAIDISEAYPARIGEWDKVAIDYGYRVLPHGDEKAALSRILDDAWTKDLRYMTNQDTDTHPRVDQWSNGVNQADELNRLMKVRRAALNRLGEHTIRNGAPMATIEEPLVPIFMYHRYSVESAASMVAGIDYIYAMRGDGRTPMKWETPVNQRKALEALANTLKPSELTVPKQVLDAIPPRPPGYGRHRELFPRTTGDGFDPLSPATVASDVTVGFTLQSDRAARMVAQHALDPSLPALEEVIDRLTKAIFDAPAANAYESEVRRSEERVLVDRVMWLATGAPNSQVRAIASLKLSKLATRLRSEVITSEPEQAQRTLLAADIKRFLERPADPTRPMPSPTAPPGAPIGDSPLDWLAPTR